MTDAVLESYLAAAERDAESTVRALHSAIRGAAPELASAIKYQLLMFASDGDWRHWVCAIDAHPKKAVGLRFLYGILLDDDLGVLRPGTSTLETWDFARNGAIDADAVGRYVREAVTKYADFKANQAAIAAMAKAAGGTRRAQQHGG